MRVSELKQYNGYFEELWDSLGTGPAPDGWIEGKDYTTTYLNGTNLPLLRGGVQPLLAGYLPENFVRPRTLTTADAVNAFDECLDNHRLSFTMNLKTFSDMKTFSDVKTLAWDASRSLIGDFVLGQAYNTNSYDTLAFNESNIIIKAENQYDELDFMGSQSGQKSFLQEPESPEFEPVVTPIPMSTPVAPKDLQMVARAPNARSDTKIGTMYAGIEFATFVDLGRVLHNIAQNCVPADFDITLRRLSVSYDAPKRTSNAVARGQCPSTQILRVRHHRPNFIDELLELSRDSCGVGYERNRNFRPLFPYEPEYVRFQQDSASGQPLNYTRHGLCPYCYEIHFYHFKTLAYGQHLALFHGIYPNNYIAPDPLYGGLYYLRKLNSQNVGRKRAAHQHIRPGVICPACFDVLECDCTKTTKLDERPLTKYLRHFRDCHIKSQRGGSTYKLFQAVLHESPS